MDTKPKPPNPYLAALLPLLGVIGLALVGLLIVAGPVIFGGAPAGMLLLGGLPLAVFVLVAVILVWVGRRRAQAGQEYLDSGRARVQWTYDALEWAALREAAWEEAKGSWKLPTGCMAILLGLAGLLAGGMVAADDAFVGAVDAEMLLAVAGGALLGALVGAVAGLLIGAVVALGNWLAARHNYRQAVPGQVALSAQELFVLGDYIKLDGKAARLAQVEWERGRPMKLLLTLNVNNPRISEQVWTIDVPERMLEAVEELAREMVADPVGANS